MTAEQNVQKVVIAGKSMAVRIRGLLAVVFAVFMVAGLQGCAMVAPAVTTSGQKFTDEQAAKVKLLMTKAEVTAAMGEPLTDKPFNPDGKSPGFDVWSYRYEELGSGISNTIGMMTGKHPITSKALDVFFNDKGKVVAIKATDLVTGKTKVTADESSFSDAKK